MEKKRVPALRLNVRLANPVYEEPSKREAARVLREISQLRQAEPCPGPSRETAGDDEPDTPVT